MLTTLLCIGFMVLFFILMSVRVIVLKDGRFKGTCASQNPFLNKEGAACGYCGKATGNAKDCANPDSEVNKVMGRFDEIHRSLS